MNADKDTGNISKDGLTGLKSKAYFLITLEQSISELQLPNPSTDIGVVTLHLGNAQHDDIVNIATSVDRQSDYATHYRSAQADVISAVYSGTPLNDVARDLSKELTERFPQLKFGIAHSELKPDSEAEKLLDATTQSAYDAMILQKPAP